MKAYLSIGSNIQPSKNTHACIRKLRKYFILRKISSIYETSPVGPVGKKNFWNLAVEIETDLSRPKLQSALRRIESELGRVRGPDKFASRPIDIDLVLYQKWKRTAFHKLAFILFPLAEIAPRLKPVGVKDSLVQLASTFLDPDQRIRRIRKP